MADKPNGKATEKDESGLGGLSQPGQRVVEEINPLTESLAIERKASLLTNSVFMVELMIAIPIVLAFLTWGYGVILILLEVAIVLCFIGVCKLLEARAIRRGDETYNVAIPLVICVAARCLGPGTARITSVTTDKDLYHSKEVMNITVLASSQEDMSNTTLKLHGIQNRHGDYQLDKEIPVNLSPGLNTLVYNHQLPSCSSCSGLSAGTYQIEVELIHNGIIVSNMTHSIQLEQ